MYVFQGTQRKPCANTAILKAAYIHQNDASESVKVYYYRNTEPTQARCFPIFPRFQTLPDDRQRSAF